MNTAVGLRFLRALARRGESTPAYMESRSRTPNHPTTASAHAAHAPANRPVAPSIRLG